MPTSQVHSNWQVLSLAGACRLVHRILSNGSLLKPESGLEDADLTGARRLADVALAGACRLVRRILSNGLLLSLGPGLTAVEVVLDLGQVGSQAPQWLYRERSWLSTVFQGTSSLAPVSSSLSGDTIVISDDDELVLSGVDEIRLVVTSWLWLSRLFPLELGPSFSLGEEDCQPEMVFPTECAR